MGSSFEKWDAVKDAAYYVGAGGEAIWLIISIVMCVAAIIVGHKHESKANSE